jgi:hypothetical protein
MSFHFCLAPLSFKISARGWAQAQDRIAGGISLGTISKCGYEIGHNFSSEAVQMGMIGGQGLAHRLVSACWLWMVM